MQPCRLTFWPGPKHLFCHYPTRVVSYLPLPPLFINIVSKQLHKSRLVNYVQAVEKTWENRISSQKPQIAKSLGEQHPSSLQVLLERDYHLSDSAAQQISVSAPTCINFNRNFIESVHLTPAEKKLGGASKPVLTDHLFPGFLHVYLNLNMPLTKCSAMKTTALELGTAIKTQEKEKQREYVWPRNCASSVDMATFNRSSRIKSCSKSLLPLNSRSPIPHSCSPGCLGDVSADRRRCLGSGHASDGDADGPGEVHPPRLKVHDIILLCLHFPPRTLLFLLVWCDVLVGEMQDYKFVFPDCANSLSTHLAHPLIFLRTFRLLNYRKVFSMPFQFAG